MFFSEFPIMISYIFLDITRPDPSSLQLQVSRTTTIDESISLKRQIPWSSWAPATATFNTLTSDIPVYWLVRDGMLSNGFFVIPITG